MKSELIRILRAGLNKKYYEIYEKVFKEKAETLAKKESTSEEENDL